MRIHTDAVSMAAVKISTHFDVVQALKPKNAFIKRLLLQSLDFLVKTNEGNERRLYETTLETFLVITARHEILAKGLFRETPFLLLLPLLLLLLLLKIIEDNCFHELALILTVSKTYMNAWATRYPLLHFARRPALVFRWVVRAQICSVEPSPLGRQEGRKFPLKHLERGLRGNLRHQSNELTLEHTGQATARENNVTRSMQQYEVKTGPRRAPAKDTDI
jgi:hypothetical protein